MILVTPWEMLVAGSKPRASGDDPADSKRVQDYLE